MYPSVVLPTSSLQPLAFLFTNATGEIVLADRNFLRLAKRAPDQPLLGEALHASLPLDAGSAGQLIRDVARDGFVGRWLLSIKTSTGSLKAIWGAGVGVYDQRESFIGADLMLLPPSSETHQAFPSFQHSDVLNSYLQQLLAEARLYKNKTFLQVYVTAQIDALQVLLARLGGPEMRNTLEQIINTTARSNLIPTTMLNGYLEFPGKLTMHFGGYGMLLRAAVDYAVNVVGRRLVGQEMQSINRQLDPGLLQLVTQLDLRVTFDD